MEVHEVINALVSKFIRVELLDVQSDSLVVKISNAIHSITVGGHSGVIVESPCVCEDTREQGWTQANGDRWLRDVLLGKVRDDAGNMIDQDSSCQATPGPWQLKGTTIRGVRSDLGRMGVVADTAVHFGNQTDMHPEHVANARLIAAAPELLAACQLLTQEAAMNALDAGRKAIRKATLAEGADS